MRSVGGPARGLPSELLAISSLDFEQQQKSMINE